MYPPPQLLLGQRIVSAARAFRAFRPPPRTATLDAADTDRGGVGGGGGRGGVGGGSLVGLRGVKEGVEWVERAAGNGSEVAVEYLAELLLEGVCVPTDLSRAYSLFRKLALGGSARNTSWKVSYCLDHGKE